MKNKSAVALGKLGGKATVKKYGKKHFSKAGKKGMAKRWGKYTYEDVGKPCPHCDGIIVAETGGYWCNKCGGNNRLRPPFIGVETK